MTRWQIVGKRVERVDAISQRLILQVQQDGRTEEAVVTGKTYDEKNVGDWVWLNLPSGRHEP